MKIMPLALGIGAFGAVGGGYFAYRQAFYAKGSKKNIRGYFEKNLSYRNAKDEVERLIEDAESFPYEDIYINSHDGLKLYAKYYHFNDGAPIDILMHGYKGNALRDMCGAHALARRLGHNILLIDHRGCGLSQGDAVTFGVLERHDTLSWVNYLTERFGDTPIFLMGVSMGGAVALMVTDMDLPKNVLGAVADCAYTSPEEIVKKVCSDRGMPRKIYPFVTLGAKLFGKFDINSQGAVKSVKHSKIPILIIHGEKDAFVPVEMAQRIFKSANCEKSLHIFENADHCASYITNPAKYEAIVSSFFEKCLSDINN